MKLTINSILFLIALALAGLIFPNDVQAANTPAENRPPSGRRTIGVVTEKDEKSFRISTRLGITLNYDLTEETKFYSLVNESFSYDLMDIGQQVAVVASRNEDSIVANVVIQLPEDFDPQQRLGIKVRGQVAFVDYAKGLITIQSLQGSQTSMLVKDITRFRGQAESLDDIEEGNWIFASGSVVGLEYPVAWMVVVAKELPPQKLPGKIESVDVASQQITLHFQNANLPITITSETKITGREQQTYQLEDLEPGILALVVAKPNQSGEWIALRVFVSNPEDLPQYDLRIQGRIQGVDTSRISVKNNQQVVEIQVDEHTRILGLGAGANLSSLHIGMRVMVGAMQVDVDTYHAEVIMVLSR